MANSEVLGWSRVTENIEPVLSLDSQMWRWGALSWEKQSCESRLFIENWWWVSQGCGRFKTPFPVPIWDTMRSNTKILDRIVYFWLHAMAKKLSSAGLRRWEQPPNQVQVGSPNAHRLCCSKCLATLRQPRVAAAGRTAETPHLCCWLKAPIGASPRTKYRRSKNAFAVTSIALSNAPTMCLELAQVYRVQLEVLRPRLNSRRMQVAEQRMSWRLSVQRWC